MTFDERAPDYATVIDLHIELFGFRPSAVQFQRMLYMTDCELQDLIDNLADQISQRDESSTTMFHELNKFIDGISAEVCISRRKVIEREMEDAGVKDIETWLYMWGVDIADMPHFMKEFDDGGHVRDTQEV